MRIGEKLDTGPVCNSYKIEIMTNDNTEQYLKSFPHWQQKRY